MRHSNESCRSMLVSLLQMLASFAIILVHLNVLSTSRFSVGGSLDESHAHAVK